MTIFRAGAGPAAQAMDEEGVTVRFGFGMVGWVAECGEPLLSNDVKREPRFVEHRLLPETRSELSIPLRAGARLLGVLDVQSERVNAFEESDVAGLEALAGQIAIAIENAQLYGKVQDQARRDSLTQVYNHGYFLERLTVEIERARAEGYLVSLIMLDIDFFKEYNDQYGHVIGDQVLGAIVEAISAHVHKSDLVGRWGGEEFCIALLDADHDEALGIANRVRETIAAARIFTKGDIPILPPTVSQGLATFPTHAPDAAALIDLADGALYRAKSRGRDQVCSSQQS
jgi:diguanylate cyclase (GGDEF)-like protein